MGIFEVLLLLVVAVAALLGVFVVGAVFWIVIASNKEWAATVDGHRVVLQNKPNGAKLYVDGAVVDSARGLAFSETLRGRLERADGRLSVVEGRVRQGPFGLTVRGYILVDDTKVGGDAT
jgi:hypothetical protein